VLGNGLVTSEGSFWLRQRRIIQPAFHRQRITRFAQTMVRCGKDMLDGWEQAARTGAPIDVHHEMMRVTVRVIGLTMLSTEVSARAGTVERALDRILHQVVRRTTSLLALPLSLPTPLNRELRAARAELDGVVNAIIAARRRSGKDEGDLLSLLMAARDEQTGEGMSDLQLRDEVMTIFLAGHETTANALTWTLYLLSKHPAVWRQLLQEVRSVVGQREPSVEDLPRLEYGMRVLQESMRLYPPVWVLVRRAEKEERLGGFPIPRHAFVAACAFVSHRNPAVFENPEGFDPDRFTPERVAALPRFAYYPFGGGPRICIGNHFALMEAQLLLTMIAQRYRLDLVPGHPVVLDPTITLRPRHGMRMFARPS
jgi:cytochrome P450